MRSTYQLKARFQAALEPVEQRLIALGITANQITAAGLTMCLAFALSINILPEWAWLLLVSPLMLMRMAINALDGMVARSTKSETLLGDALNEIADILSDLAVYPAVVFMATGELIASCLVGGAILSIEVLSIVLAARNEYPGDRTPGISQSSWAKTQQSAKPQHGPFGKSDRALFFSLWSLLLVFSLPQAFSFCILILFSLLATLTARNRARLC